MSNWNSQKLPNLGEITRSRVWSQIAIAVAVACLFAPAPAFAKKGGGKADFCSSTAAFQYAACGSEVRDDSFTALAICTNVEDGDEREECTSDAREETSEARDLCREQFHARRELCEDLGEDRYDPDFDPGNFETTFTNLNEFFPIQSGNFWEYESEDETVSVAVHSATKLIDDVTCIVVVDTVSADGEVVEDTEDWFGQRTDGTVDYCGELSRDFEIFPGDNPEEPQLVSLEGSFKAGVDGAKSGTLFMGSPVVGQFYRQEWAPGDAEDAAEVLSTTYGFGNGNPELDELVPEDLADLLCGANDCVVTREFSPLSPGVFERKYYARGIGFFLETNPDEGEFLQLVDCNVDPKCAVLPTP